MKWAALILVIFVGACSAPPPNKFSDPVIQKIYELSDRRLADSLAVFLDHTNANYRAAAALSFGSVQDSSVSKKLGDILLEDTDPEVRRNAAFALGQTGGYAASNALIPAMNDTVPEVLREVMEALGKTIDELDLHVLHRSRNLSPLALEGTAWGYYRLGIRNLTDSIIIRNVSNMLLPSNAVEVRRLAAQFFARIRSVKGFNEDALIKAVLNDGDVEVRMAAARGLRHLPRQRAADVVSLVLKNESDYRVKCNAIRAITGIDVAPAEKLLFSALNDDNLNVRITASEILSGKLNDPDSAIAVARSEPNWRVKANLYKAIMGAGKMEIAEEVISSYKESKNDYEKSWLLSALSENSTSKEFVADQLLNSASLVVQTAAANAIASINNIDKNKTDPGSFLSVYKDAISKSDKVTIGIIASAMADPSLNFKTVVDDTGFLHEARKKLSLPEDIETIRPLEKAIAYFEGRSAETEAQNKFNHPIPWDLVKTIPREQKVKISTNKGEVIMRLFVEEAPGAVANFVELINQKYFDGNRIHRVVPNFVIQAGCKRGDGYGSEDYSIRSEFSLRRYAEGSVGMASAGKDTEGTQWFITHSSTPHLDGGYTIFAEVVSGMEFVHQIEVGDQIESISLIDN